MWSNECGWTKEHRDGILAELLTNTCNFAGFIAEGNFYAVCGNCKKWGFAPGFILVGECDITEQLKSFDDQSCPAFDPAENVFRLPRQLKAPELSQ